MQKVIDEMLAYMQSFIERPHHAFGGIPVCPFAAKARTEDKIKFVVLPILASEEEIIDEIVEFSKQNSKELIMFINPDKDLPLADLFAFTEKIGKLFGSYYMIFTGHPLDEFTIAGVKVRQDPYPNFQVVRTSTVLEARKKLTNTSYYARWSPDDLAADGIK